MSFAAISPANWVRNAPPERRWPWLLAGVVLVGALALQSLPLWRAPRPSTPPHLAGTIGRAPAGWTSHEVALGPNEFLASEVEKVLNYDEVFYREYQRGEQRFGVYIAYWSAGKMPTQLVASHTPDRCWTENGWQCLEMRFRQTGLIPGIVLPPAEWRRFAPPQGGAPTHVLFWHLVGGEVHDFGERFNAVPDPVKWWRDAMRTALRGNEEQYFIRITSDRSFEELGVDPGFRDVMANIAQLTRPAAQPSPSSP